MSECRSNVTSYRQLVPTEGHTMTTQPGFYSHRPGAAAQCFWDGQQWVSATGYMAVPVTVGAPAPRTFVDRHPKMVGFGIFWVACMALHWWWMAPMTLLGVAAYFTAKYYRARNARLAAAADYENYLYAQGKPAGTYGRYYQPGVSDALSHDGSDQV